MASIRLQLLATGLVLALMRGVSAEEVDKDLLRRGTDFEFFKGEPIPEVNWNSTDIYNFTWGLTGVDNYENFKFANSLWISCAVLIGVLLMYRIAVQSYYQVRLVATVASGRPHTIFSQPLSGLGLFFQKHIVDAPLFFRRHNDPFQFRPLHLHFGTLPSRVNGLLLSLYVLSNVLYCTLYLPWNGNIGPDGKLHEPTKASLVAEFRGRTGVMAVVNMIPLFVCMMRNNYVGKAVGVGFNTWNLWHRWLGRIVFLESWAHMIAWVINKIDQSNWADLYQTIADSRFFQVGLMAEFALLMILVLSIAPLRHSHYQFFLTSHQICVAIFVIGVFMHCHIDELPQKTWVIIAMSIWIFERLHRVFTIIVKNISFKRPGSFFRLICSTAEVTAVAGGEDAVHVAVEMQKGWQYQPGTHAYIYIPRLGWTQSHPFSIAWSSTTEPTPSLQERLALHEEKASSSTVELTPTPTPGRSSTTTIHFIISRKGGFTNRLYQAVKPRARPLDAEKPMAPPTKRYLCFIEGPYSNEAYNFDSFSTLLFVAGGSGITHPLGHIRQLLIKSSEDLVAARRIKLVWIIRDMKNYTWISDWVRELNKLDAGRRMFEVEVYITRATERTAPRGAPKNATFFSGRPQPGALIDRMREEAGKDLGAMSVNVCGPGGLSDSFRAAVRGRAAQVRIEYSEESFTWS